MSEMTILSGDSMSDFPDDSVSWNTKKKGMVGKKVAVNGRGNGDKEIVCVDKEFSPEAVTEYSRIGSKGLMSMAKMHLSAVGWSFYYQKKGVGRELRYQSPNGRIFYSLLTACRWYTRNQQLSLQNGEIAHTRDQELSLQKGEIEHICDPELAVKKGGIRWKPKMKRVSLLLRQSLVPPSETKKRPDSMKDEDLSRKRPRQEAVAHCTILSKLIDANIVSEGTKVDYRHKKDGYSLKEGKIHRQGIICCCCGQVFGLSKFEAHAGSTDHRPSAHLFLEDGRSIQECQKSDQGKDLDPGNRSIQECQKSDYICSVCYDDGNLLLCDKCPSAFHTRCLGLQDVPEGDWFCASCSCRICNLVSIKHCKEEDKDLHMCVQCAHRYHISCLRRRGLIHKPQGNGNWFCSSKCEEIHLGLQNLLGKPVAVVGQDNLEWTLYKHNASDNECVSKLNGALSIIHECFEPVKEAYNRRDIVEDAIFNKWSDLHRLNFQGFYTLALERNDELITVALIRIHGEKVAEIPLVATRFEYRRLGMCRILMNQLEKTLMELGVERLVLPAASSVLHTWENKFGFSKVNECDRLKFLGCTFLDFHGTTMCQKLLNNIHSQEQHIDGHISEAFEADQKETRQLIQALFAETSKKRKPTDAFKSYKKRKLASNGSRCIFAF